jgi:hypothetical protein
VEYLLAASEGDLPDLDASFGNDQEATTGFTLFEDGLSGAEAPHRAPPGQMTQLGGREGSKVRNSPQSFGIRSVALGS